MTHATASRNTRSLSRFALRCLAAAGAWGLACAPALAWDAHGHRLITTLGMERLAAAKSCPDWLKDPHTIAMAADQAATPDRWRSGNIAQLKHLNDPDHYIDAEDLADFGLSLRTIPNLRNECIKQLALARDKGGPDFPGRPINPAADPAKTQEWPGFAPYAICENYGKVQSAFKTVRTLEKLNDPRRADQMCMAKANALTQVGIMAHYLGDCAQPLHTTRHHHGWVGDNPNGYTTNRAFHGEIDGAVLKRHRIVADTVRPALGTTLTVNPKDPWNEVINYIDRSFQTVEPLYQLKKSGDLDGDKGKEFIVARLADAGEFLGVVLVAAWESAEPTDKDLRDFVGFDNFDTPSADARPAG